MDRIIIIVAAIMAFTCWPALDDGSAAGAIGSKSLTISRLIDRDGTATVKWKKRGKRKCVVYVKRGGGKFRKVGVSRTGKLTFRTRSGSVYTVRIRMGLRVSRKVKFKANGFAAPRIISLSVYPRGGKTLARLVFYSKKGRKYAVFRKGNDGTWTYRGIVRAKGKKTSFYDPVRSDCTYTVCRYGSAKKGTIHRYGRFDRAGIKTIMAVPSVSLDTTNLDTTVSWSPVKGADGYSVYMKVGKTARSYRRLATTNRTKYRYMYYYGLKTKAEIHSTAGGASHRYFVDPDSNPFVYIVRAYKRTGSKISYGNHLADGEYSVITPNILSYNGKTLTWHTVRNANQYKVYTSADGKRWTCRGRYKAGPKRSQSAAVPAARYYGVSSVTRKNGRTFESGWDRTFDVSHRKSNRDRNVLWIGCSTEFASPYYSWNDILHVNSYPNRIAQCTGVRFYNPSIPGATLAARYNRDGSLNMHRYRLIRNVVEKVKNGTNTMGPYYCETKNRQRLEDFDIVMIPAGGNDYTDDIPIGSPRDMSDTTFYGALNLTVDWIDQASRRRVAAGKAPIKIVFVQLVYGERYKSLFLERHSRVSTPNALGKTYRDYQDAMFDVCRRCREEGMQSYWIPTDGYVDHENCPYVTSDNIHLTRFTYSQLGNGMSREMIRQGILR